MSLFDNDDASASKARFLETLAARAGGVDVSNVRVASITKMSWGVRVEVIADGRPALGQSTEVFGCADAIIEQVLAGRVPTGHYAVTGEDGTTDFYAVSKMEVRGVRTAIVENQRSEALWPVNAATSRAVLIKILAAGVFESMQRYGAELGICGHCRITLTNEKSRAMGFGPTCAKAVRGWVGAA